MKIRLHPGTWKHWGHPSGAGKVDGEAGVSINHAGLVPGPSRGVCFQGDWPRLFTSPPMPTAGEPGPSVLQASWNSGQL